MKRIDEKKTMSTDRIEWMYSGMILIELDVLVLFFVYYYHYYFIIDTHDDFINF